MGIYKFRIVSLGLIFAMISFMTTFMLPLAISLGSLSFILISGWWCSNYPGMLLRDISKKVGKGVGAIVTFSSMVGTVAIAGYAAMVAAKPILIRNMEVDTWHRYDWYFLVMYLFPAILVTYFLVRGVLFFKDLK